MNSDGEASSSSKVEEALKKLSLESSSSRAKEEVVESSSLEVPKKLLKFRTNDGEVFEVEESIMLQSETIKIMIEDYCIDGEIPLDNMSGNILGKVLEYCKKHVGDGILNVKQKEELREWDLEFIELERTLLFNVLIAANYLGVKGLLELGCRKLAERMKGKNVEQVREMFGIVNDFTPEEEAELRKKDRWVMK